MTTSTFGNVLVVMRKTVENIRLNTDYIFANNYIVPHF